MRALLPALFLALLTLWSGTFAGGATFLGAASSHTALLAFCLLGAPQWRNPLRLDRYGRWLVPGLLLAVAASWWASPVRRAGILSLLLLPAFLLIPAAVTQCWNSPQARRRGVTGICLLLGLTSVVALVNWLLQGSARAAMPLGHHNLLAGWLVIVWPLGLLPLRWTGIWRILPAAVATAAVAALAASASFLGAGALVVQSLVAGFWWKRARPWLALAVLCVWIGPMTAAKVARLVAARDDSAPATESRTFIQGSPSQLHRARGVVLGVDHSTKVRTIYVQAGWNGFIQRPLLGWGPGSVPWTVAEHIRPVAGLNPPSEVVGELHSSPFHVGYELGLTGLVFCTALFLFFGRRRLQELAVAEDTHLLQAACVALTGGTVFLLGNAPLSVFALPAAAAVVAGAALAATPNVNPPRSPAWLGLGLVYLAPVALVLLPLERAHYHYQRATRAVDPHSALSEITKASEMDPTFPLYRARRAWLAAALGDTDPDATDEALLAAQQAGGVAPLWLAAGAMALDIGEPWSARALTQARDLDPLSPLSAFHLMRARLGSPEAVELGARAIAGDRRLRAALFWEEHPELLAAVLAHSQSLTEKAGPGPAEGPIVRLALTMDAKPATSFSLFAFRRSPWVADLAAVELRSERLPL